MVEAEKGDRVPDLMEAFDADWGNERVCGIVEGVEGGAGGEDGWRKDGRVGRSKAADEVYLGEGLGSCWDGERSVF